MSTFKGFPKEWPPVKINPFDNFDSAYKNVRDGFKSVDNLRRILVKTFEDIGPIDVKKDFGAVGNAIVDDTAAIQAALDLAETNGRVGGMVFLPKGQYLCTGTLQLGDFVSLVGENAFSSSLQWGATPANGNLIELGPDAGGAHVFGARLENLDLNSNHVYRGLDKAVVYTEGAHQYSGLRNVSIRNFRSFGVHHDMGIGGPAAFFLDQVSIDGSGVPPTSGTTNGLVCTGGGAFIKCDDLVVQGSPDNLMTTGVKMLKDHLVLDGGHFENCIIGVSLQQNENLPRTNSIRGITGNNTVPTLVQVTTTHNLVYTLDNVSNTTALSINLDVLIDNSTGVTIGGTNGVAVAYYASEINIGSAATITRHLSATASLDFDLTSVDTQDLTIAVPGAALGDSVALGVPHGSVTASTMFSAWVSSTNTVTVRAMRIAGTPDPTAGTFRVDVWKH